MINLGKTPGPSATTKPPSVSGNSMLKNNEIAWWYLKPLSKKLMKKIKLIYYQVTGYNSKHNSLKLSLKQVNTRLKLCLYIFVSDISIFKLTE